MNSPTANAKQTIQQMTERLLMQEEAMAKMGAQINQLQRILWLVVDRYGKGEVQIHEGSLPPLWMLEKRRDHQNGLILNAVVMPEPPEDKMTALVDKLMNTELDLLAVQKELGLEQYPANFLAFHISDKIILTDGKWLPNTIARAAFGQEGQN